MNEAGWWTKEFEARRAHLIAVAFRMLGSVNEAEDAVQEAWIRLSRTDPQSVENLGGWLTTVVARVCLDVLRSRTSRREEAIDLHRTEVIGIRADGISAEDELQLADSVGAALLVVLETLTPAERLAFVLHDLFAVSFEEIAEIVGRSPAAARQLASRARRRVQGASPEIDPDIKRQRQVVDAFLAASHDGDFEALLRLLDPEVVMRADAEVVRIGTVEETRGAQQVAAFFKNRARGAKRALVDGVPGAVWIHEGRPRVVFDFTVENGRIRAIQLLGDQSQLAELQLQLDA